ncbi:MAG: T9SS type A sorting domain-containing protein, partial [Candidatus Marinimicrobia bacterium]|nr:T9SS type A sorting domain-containing protein [Candidatus Neomarinimicrobiota bacterium]
AVEQSSDIPTSFALHQNYPNPFNPSTTLRFDLSVASDVTMIVYDLLGREVVRLVEDQLQPGTHQVLWDGKTAGGRDVPTGIYIARMSTPAYTRSIKLVLLK